MTSSNTLEKYKQLFENMLKEDVCQVIKSEESTDGNVYIIQCKTKKYVAKLYKSKQHAKSMVALHQKLIKHDINLPQIICSNINNVQDEYIVVYSFIEGIQIADVIKTKIFDKKIIYKIASMLRKMHDIDYESNEFKLPELSFLTYNERKTLLHFDLTKHNVFLLDNEDIAIIDFDDAKYGPAIYDISIFITFFFISTNRGVDIEKINDFLTEYYLGNEKIKNRELPFISSCALEWIDYILNQNTLDKSMIEIFKKKKEIIYMLKKQYKI